MILRTLSIQELERLAYIKQPDNLEVVAELLTRYQVGQLVDEDDLQEIVDERVKEETEEFDSTVRNLNGDIEALQVKLEETSDREFELQEKLDAIVELA